jgi:EmrB/QacA subfamily drug resistance transporter
LVYDQAVSDTTDIGSETNGVAAVDAVSTSRRVTIFAVVGVALIMTALDQTIVATALPTIRVDLHTRLNVASWTITIYSLGSAVTYTLVGRLADRIGGRRVFLIAITVFTIASLCCGLATNIYWLIALRALQAIGGASIMPSSTKIIAYTFGSSRDRALGSFITIFSIGAISGPIIGGFFITYGSWRDIFFVNVPIGVVLVVGARGLLPQTPLGPRRHIDFAGLGLVTTAVLSAMLAITHLGERGATIWDPMTIGPFAVTAVAVPLLLRHLGRSADPFLPARMLYGKGFGAINLINVVYGATTAGFSALVPLYAITRFHLVSLEAGTLLSARAIGSILVASISVVLLRRTGYRRPIVAGFALTAAGQLGIALCPSADVAYVWLSVAAGVTGIGMGIATPAANNASLQLMPYDSASIAGLRAMFRQCGSIIAISVATAVAARSSNPGAAQAFVFIGAGVALLLVAGLVRWVPEHRGAW